MADPDRDRQQRNDDEDDYVRDNPGAYAVTGSEGTIEPTVRVIGAAERWRMLADSVMSLADNHDEPVPERVRVAARRFALEVYDEVGR
jgi:hypothetical protein